MVKERLLALLALARLKANAGFLQNHMVWSDSALITEFYGKIKLGWKWFPDIGFTDSVVPMPANGGLDDVLMS